MKSILFSILLLSLSINASCQEGLLIRNTKNGKSWMYEKNARVTYIQFHEEEYTTGIIHDILDSAVVFGKDTVLVKNIAGIRKKSPIHGVSRIAGMPLMLIGSLLMGDGIAGMISNRESDNGTKVLLLGAGIFALGYLPYGLSLEDLDVGFRGVWVIEIYRGGPLPKQTSK